MDRKLKRWEMALMLGLLCALVGGSWLGQEQHELADSVIRFHVIANSDSAQDQALKLAVRDRVLEEAQAVYPSNATLESARSALESSLTQLADAGRQVVEEQGYDYPVSAQLTQCWFPTKEYDGFALPAGNYTALRVVIGEGEGQNWWCVLYPNLCFLDAVNAVVPEEGKQKLEQVLTEEEYRQVTAGGKFEIRFKLPELLGSL